MADLAGVFTTVSRASSLALELYSIATTAPSAANDINRLTKSISSFSSIVKQVATIIREDDRLPSHDAIETLHHVLDQCNSSLTEIKSILPSHLAYKAGRREDRHHGSSQGFRLVPSARVRLGYLTAHLDSLRSTLSVMAQIMQTAQSVVWAKTRPTISPQQAATAIANEHTQLETLVIEQQMLILLASKTYHLSRPEARLLMENDSSLSLVSVDNMNTPLKPVDLFRYQERSMTSLDTSTTSENDWLPAICRVSKSYCARLLESWTRLRQLQESINDEERKVETQKRETLQPMVESDIEDEVGALPDFNGSDGAGLNTPTPHRPGSVQPLFAEPTTLPIQVPDAKYGPAAPLSPASSYEVSPTSSRSSRRSLPSANMAAYSPSSSRLSVSSLPVEAAAAVEAKDNDDEVNLEIPWTLRTRHHCWDYIDSKMKSRSTELPPPGPFSERNAWTELLASWVCKEAIQETSYKFTKVQKDRRDGRRTRPEICFCVQQPLSFDQVQKLVDRTVELYRKNIRPSPPPPQRQTSFGHSGLNRNTRSSLDRNRTPFPSQQQCQPPALDRSSSYPHPPPPLPSLDRSFSMPGPTSSYLPQSPLNPHPTSPYLPQSASNPHPTTLHLPLATGPDPPHAPPYSPQAPSLSPPFYPPQGAAAAQYSSPPPPPPPPPTDPRRSSASVRFPPSPIQSTRRFSASSSSLGTRSNESKGSRRNHHSSGYATSDEENGGRRKHKSRSIRRVKSRVGGLAALLDKFADLGVL